MRQDKKKKSQEHCSVCFIIYTNSYDDKIYFQVIQQSSALEIKYLKLTWLKKGAKENL